MSSSEFATWKSRYDKGTFSEITGRKSHGVDENALNMLGKKQELKRRFGFLSICGFSCCILVTWETVLAVFEQAFINGGPAGIVWGFPIVWLCSISVYICLAEMASIAPIAGGQYFWVAILAPPKQKRFLSYLTGWLTTLAWVATLATGMVLVGTIVQGLIILNYPSYVPENWHGTLLAWSVIFVAIIINTLVAGLLPFLEGCILILHILGFFAVMIPLVYLAPHVPAKDVFFRPLNEGMWPSQALSILVGFIGNVSTFVGADAAVHMSEEIDNAALNVPRSILTTLILNGATGYGMVLALLFSINNIESAINTKTGFAFIQIFADGVGNAGATAMIVIVLVLAWCAVTGFLATASRMLWSFARDQAVPFSGVIRKVNTTTSIPVYAVAIATIIPMLLSLIRIGSKFAYTNVISMSVSGLYFSYLFPCSLLLWRRCTGQIKPYDKTKFASMDSGESGRKQRGIVELPGMQDDSTVVDIPLAWGPWSVPGIWEILNNALACVYCVFVLFWSFWPPEYPATPGTMNYAVAATGFVFIFATGYYYVYGKKYYKGPLIEFTT